VAITCLRTPDPEDIYGHKKLTLPAEVVLDTWVARYGSTPQPVDRQAFEDGSADPLLHDMAVIVYRLCRRNMDYDLFEYITRTHRVYATYDFLHDCTFVRVDLVVPHE